MCVLTPLPVPYLPAALCCCYYKRNSCGLTFTVARNCILKNPQKNWTALFRFTNAAQQTVIHGIATALNLFQVCIWLCFNVVCTCYALLKCGVILSVLFNHKAVGCVCRSIWIVILVRAAVTAGYDRWCIFRLVCRKRCCFKIIIFGHNTAEQWRRQLWDTGARAPPPSTSNNFIFSSLWSSLREPTIQVVCSLRDQLMQMSTTRSSFDQYCISHKT